MTLLVDALETLGLTGEITHTGHWVCLPGERCPVYVVEVSRDGGYFSWCGAPDASVVEFYRDPVAAIRAGLGRAARRAPSSCADSPDPRATDP
jgi:hypothetical protein